MREQIAGQLANTPKKQELDPQDEQVIQLAHFAREHSMSGDELFAAHKIALDIQIEATEDESPLRSEVVELSDMMRAFIENGLALSRIAELIGAKNTVDFARESYGKMIAAMKITEPEKRALLSIVEKKRSGTIMIHDGKTGELLSEITLKKGVDVLSEDDIALALMQHLESFLEKDISINFSE